MDNSQTMRYAIYARYSSDLQRHTSIADQMRKCHEFGQAQGWVPVKDCIYADEAISGITTERPGLQRMLQTALSPHRPFDIILVDDTSRISRSLSDAVQLFEKLRFAGVRVIAVAQGIDTRSEQADVLVTVHGLVDSLYVKELAKKTHRGLEGAFLRGMHAGGRCYGYRNVPVEGGVRLEIEESEAAVVRRIFEMSANGMSLKAIAKALNSDRVSPPRPRAAKTTNATWAPTAIREMLRRELFVGRVIWNRLPLHQGSRNQQARSSVAAQDRMAHQRASRAEDRQRPYMASRAEKADQNARAVRRKAGLTQSFGFKRESSYRFREMRGVRGKSGHRHRASTAACDVWLPAALVSGSLREQVTNSTGACGNATVARTARGSPTPRSLRSHP